MSRYSIILLAIVLVVIACKKNASLPPEDPKTPKLITNEFSNLTILEVTLNGKITNQEISQPSEIGFVVDTIPEPTYSKNLKKYPAKTNTNGDFSITLLSIYSKKMLFVRTYAVNAIGTTYGNEIKFTTLEDRIYYDNVNLTTQKEVNEFGAKNYTTIQGQLKLSGSIVDLSPLKSIVAIYDGFYVTRTELTNFKGLDNLELIGLRLNNGFTVESNHSLVNFRGLSKLRFSRGHTYISDNSIQNMDGLESYSHVVGDLRIVNCNKIQNLSALKSLQTIGGDLTLDNNPLLNDITGLENLSLIGYRLRLQGLSSLQNLNGLEKITTLTNGIELLGNKSLTDIKGIGNLATCPSIRIEENDALTNLDPFKKITSLSFLLIRENDLLPNLNGFGSLQEVKENMEIINNSALIDLSGLEKMIRFRNLSIRTNKSLLSLIALSNCIAMNQLIITSNTKLKSLSGLDKVVEVNELQINANPSLTDFCPLKMLFKSGKIGVYTIMDNATNPIKSEIVNCP